MKKLKCKICRRAGVKLFLKGEKCLSPKCIMTKRAYPPGQKGKRRTASLSEYGKELREKQKLKNWYGLKEVQLKNYVKKILESKRKKEDTVYLLIKILESRLDNVIFRLGFAISRRQAQQLISHGYFLVNNKTINISSYLVKVGDVIALKPQKLKKKIFDNLLIRLKKQKIPSWLKLDIEKLEGKVVGAPSLEEAVPPVEISAVFEYYSR